MKKKKKLSLAKILMVLLIILIPVVISLFAVHKLHLMQPSVPQGGIYSHVDTAAVTYNQQDSNKLAELEQNRQKLIPSDAIIKVDLMKQTNPLADTADYTITYDFPTDMFQAQINTINIDTAKKEADQWFFDQGMSVEAPCELPLRFTLSKSVIHSLKGLDVVFSPLAPGC